MVQLGQKRKREREEKLWSRSILRFGRVAPIRGFFLPSSPPLFVFPFFTQFRLHNFVPTADGKRFFSTGLARWTEDSGKRERGRRIIIVEGGSESTSPPLDKTERQKKKGEEEEGTYLGENGGPPLTRFYFLPSFLPSGYEATHTRTPWIEFFAPISSSSMTPRLEVTP